jgi:catechol 2,3-dioxygenase-like lactoylglutathione lyase family enzyme
MKPIAAAVIFAMGLLTGQLLGAQQPLKSDASLPAERLTGIGGVFMKAKDPKALGQWYSDKLGMPRPDGPVPPLFLWRERDNADAVGTTVWGLFPSTTKYFGPGPSTCMINYRVRNLERMLAQLRAQGVQVDGKIEDDFNGRFASVTDPEGNRIQLWEPVKGY